MLSLTKSRLAGKTIFKLFLLITFLFLSNADLLAQYTWTKYQGNPVIPSGPSGSWYRGVITPCVIYNEDLSRYEMWFAGSATTYGERPLRIGFAYSNDGISWVIHPNQIVAPRPGNWDNYSVYAPWVIRENGQYKMWYTHEAPGYTDYKLGYATSPDGINWTRLDYPVMEGGTAEWEAQGVGLCNVLPGTGGYKMWYSGLAGTSDTTSIGYAFSTDGISWQRDTVNNPILTPGSAGQWDDFNIFAPRVIILDNIYYMYYGAARETFGQYRVGLATSTDGIDWEKYWNNPVLRPSTSGWDNSEIETATVIKMGDTLKLWYDGSKSGTYVWQIGLATSHYLPNALAPGTYTIGTGGNFATIQDAFNKLETDGVAGNVTLELIDELYTAPTDSFGFKLNGPIPGAGPNSRVTIKPALDKNVVIQGDNQAVFYLLNTSYVTFDGVSITGSTTLTIHSLENITYEANHGIFFVDDCDHNVIQNIILIGDDYTRLSGSGFWQINIGPGPDNNLIQNNFVKKAGIGLFIISAYEGSYRGKNNIIRGNIIGSETDSLISYGLAAGQCENSIIENNIIQNMKGNLSGSQYAQWGILSENGYNDIIRNNVISNLSSSSGWGSMGIFLGQSGNGINTMVYNNMICDIQSTSTQYNSRVAGIYVFAQTNPKIYYNTVYLSGTGTNQDGSAALNIDDNVTLADVKNNIFVNTRDEGQYCASAIYDYTAGNLASDYNDLYYDDTNNNNCLVRISSTNYHTLADWQATGKDLHSYVEMPHFMSPTDLHIDETIATYLESRGTPIAGIDKDFDGQTRHATTPDIGADEFNGIVVGVEDEETVPTEYALLQNYPNPFNPNTRISWQSPVGSHQTIKVFDVLGNEIATLVDEYKSAGRYEVEFNAEKLASGIYFYQLKAGEFIQTRKMLLIK